MIRPFWSQRVEMLWKPMVHKPLMRPYFWKGYVRRGRSTSRETNALSTLRIHFVNVVTAPLIVR